MGIPLYVIDAFTEKRFVGILEDPVTGSAHCTLIPCWATRLNKTSLYAIQLSQETGRIVL
jgi:predicted PhzF superfamily epimerase YddE/YHI9